MSVQDPWGNPVAQNFELLVAMGAFAQWGVIAARATGYAPAVTLNTPVNVRGTAYVAQAAAAQRSIVSTSALDTAAGTGARTVTINYLDSNMVLKQETIALNGITPVNTVNVDIRYIESMVVATSGTDFTNDGAINLMTGLAGAGTIWAAMAALDGATFYCHHYVPAGVTCYVLKHTGCGTLAAGRTLLIVAGDPRVVGPLQQVGDIILHLAGGSEDHDYRVPLVVVGPNLIIARENPVASAAGNLAYASIDYVQF